MVVSGCTHHGKKSRSDTYILLYSDNQDVIAAHQQGQSHNFMSNLSIHQAGMVCMVANISPALVYVESAINKADPVSQGILLDICLHIVHTVILPDELNLHLTPVI